MKKFYRNSRTLRIGAVFGLLVAMAVIVSACAANVAGAGTPAVTVAPTLPSIVGTSIPPAGTPTTAVLPTSGSTATPGVPENSFSANILIRDNMIVPKVMTVPQGTIVIWRNSGQQAHTITSKDGSFDSGPIAPGQTFQFTFNQQGTFDYTMDGSSAGGTSLSGQIIVTEPPTPIPTSAP